MRQWAHYTEMFASDFLLLCLSSFLSWMHGWAWLAKSERLIDGKNFIMLV